MSDKPGSAAKTPHLMLGKIIWGLLFVLFGVMLLLQNFNIISIDLGNIWRLWPIVIIAAGLSLLSFRGWMGIVVTSIFAALLLGLIVAVAIGTK